MENDEQLGDGRGACDDDVNDGGERKEGERDGGGS